MWTDGRTDTRKLIVAFSQICEKASKNETRITVSINPLSKTAVICRLKKNYYGVYKLLNSRTPMTVTAHSFTVFHVTNPYISTAIQRR